ncbi:MAG: dihydropteroate synthase [Geitlerinemataceae cyanobacterium]
MQLRERQFNWGAQTYLMGVLNVTPDSFSDGGKFDTVDAALGQAKFMEEAGVDLVDIGGQSTRPGAMEIAVEEELNRVVPVVRALRKVSSIPISVDTSRSIVARAAVAAGADVVNDISGGTGDPQMLATVAQLRVPVVLMHLRGTPETMQTLTDYEDLVGEICQVLERRANAAISAGVDPKAIVLDPGIGFAKTHEQNLTILRELPKVRSLGYPVLVGVSRKSFIGRILDRPNPNDRVWGTGAACAAAIVGGADILRVHDVREMGDICRVADAIFRR